MSNRTLTVGGVWAKNSVAAPTTPVAGTAYKKPTMTQAQVEAGWRFDTVVNSPEFNEVMNRLTGLVMMVEKYGVIPYCATTTYDSGSLVLGSDMGRYRCLFNTTLNKDPVVDTSYWERDEIYMLGAVQAFYRNSAPRGWLALDGKSIGNASSGATARANADTINLFTYIWTEFPTTTTILNSSGVVTTRGASALADFNANKRIVLLNLAKDFIRGSGAGLATGTHQDASTPLLNHTHTQTVHNHTVDAHHHSIPQHQHNIEHTHTVPGTLTTANWFTAHNYAIGPLENYEKSLYNTTIASGTTNSQPTTVSGWTQPSNTGDSWPATGNSAATSTGAASDNSENRPQNTAMLYCIKY